MTEKFPILTGTELVRVFERLGFVVSRQKGSHVHMHRAADRKRATIPVHRGKSLPIGTLKGILRDADVSLEQLRTLI